MEKKTFPTETPVIPIPGETVIKPCPCCGSAAEIRAVSQYGTFGAQIRCPKCHVETAPVAASLYMFYRGKKDVTFTLETAAAEVIGIWNNRVDGAA